MNLWNRLKPRDPPPPAEIDRTALRAEMSRRDPDFAHVRDVYHDTRGLLTGPQLADQIHDRFNERLRDSWRPSP